MYSRWYNDDTIGYLVASTYAEAKGWLFGLFFGWRMAHNNESRFLFSRKDWANIDDRISYYETFVKKS